MKAEQYAERRARVAELTGLGWTAKQIGDHLGISVRRVKYDRVVGGSARPKAPNLTADEKRRALALLKGGSSYYAAAKTLGRSDMTLRANFPGYGRPPVEPVGERRDEVERMARTGMSTRRIAATLGVSVSAVTRDRRARGVPGPQPEPMSDDEKRSALALLQDGVSYAEVARTLGRTYHAIAKHFPGYAFDKRQAAEAAALTRQWNRLERASNVPAGQHGKGKAA